MPAKKPYRKTDRWANEKELAVGIGSGVNDVIGRGTLAGLLGAPGDIAGMAENGIRALIGLPQVQPWGGSEHIGSGMEKAGLVSNRRRPKTELLASLISPAQLATASLKAPQYAKTALKLLDNLDAPSTLGRGLANSQLGIFAGAKAKNAPIDALEQGAKLLDEGADPRKVWQDLGVFRGADGKMRWEIDDSKAVLDPVSYADVNDWALVSDRLQHQELYDAYPKLNNTRFEKARSGVKGSWDGQTNHLGLHSIGPKSAYDKKQYARFMDAQKSTIGHEFQHGAQELEGFSGGTPFEGDINQYLRNAGEAEARATQSRLPLNAEQRRALYPFDSYDVPVNELIHTQGNGSAMSVEPTGLLGKMIAPQDEALRVAQQNAAKPVSEGGLGLRPDNTPEERAAAMGFDTPQFHYSRADRQFDSFQPKIAIGNTSYLDGLGVHSGTESAAADRFNSYWKGTEREPTGFTLPLLVKGESQLVKKSGDPYTESELRQLFSKKAKAAGMKDPSRSGDSQLAIRKAIAEKYNTVPYVNKVEGGGDLSYLTPDPKNIRSRFAAFDPMRRDSSDLLAGLSPLLLARPQEKEKKK